MPSKHQLIGLLRLQTEICQRGADLPGIMNLVTEHLPRIVDADGAAIELLDGDHMVYRAASGIARDQLGLTLAVRHSLSGMSLARGEALYCRDCETDDRVNHEACRLVGLRSMIVLPLQHESVSLGVLKAMSRRVDGFTPSDLVLMNMLTQAVSAAMYYASRYDHDALFQRATHDMLTGLANRALFIDRLRSLLALNQRSPQPFAVLMLDMDGLKLINDQLGHAAGDAALRSFAQRLTACARATDTVARVGGDEFAVLLHPLDDLHGIEAATQRIEHALVPPCDCAGQACRLRVSIGTARYPDDGQGADQLLGAADRHMYAVKRSRQGPAGRSDWTPFQG